MTLRKTHLRKMTIAQITQRLEGEVNVDNIKLITNFIQQKNQALIDKREALIQQLRFQRVKVQKSVKDMNGRVKDRIDKQQKVIMNKDSRPTPNNINELTQLFLYFQNQGSIIRRNNQDIAQQLASRSTYNQNLLAQHAETINTTQLDQSFAQLEAKCQKQEIVRDRLKNYRDQRRNEYKQMQASIQQCRIEYQHVQGLIRDAQRQFVQLKAYLEARQLEDATHLKELPQESLRLAAGLQQAQRQYNACSRIRQELKIKQIQTHKE